MKSSDNETAFQLQHFGGLGVGFQTPDVLVFFGNGKTDLSKIQNSFSNIGFRRIRQTHSDIIVPSISDSLNVPFENLTEADAHFTDEKGQGLLILTADCLPVMIFCRQTSRVSAVHAGWRGVENRIVEKTLLSLIQSGSDQKDFLIWIGPHIQLDSFEAGADAFELLSQAHNGLFTDEYSYQKSDKYFINLKLIVKSQIDHIVKKNIPIWFSDDDTKSDPSYNSFRRDQTKTRNLSFIARL